MGYAIQADEEQLRIKLEAIQAELSAPTQFKVLSFILWLSVFMNILRKYFQLELTYNYTKNNNVSFF